MEYFISTVLVSRGDDPLVAVELRIKARTIVTAARKLKLFMDNYDYSSLYCLRSICRTQFTNSSNIPCL